MGIDNDLLLRELQAASETKDQILQKLIEIVGPVDDVVREGELSWRVVRKLLADLRDRLSGSKPRVVLRGTPGATPVIAPEFPALTWVERLIALIIEPFVPLSRSSSDYLDDQRFPRKSCGALFRDAWHIGLPMDNAIDDELFPVGFTEVWLPIKHAEAALQALHDAFIADRLDATGTFAIELYAAASSPAWLSPAYGCEEGVLRIDPFWCYNRRRDTPDEEEARQQYFRVFWRVLAKPEFEARLHWGKALPPGYEASLPAGAVPADGLSWNPYPKLADFLALRRQEDPHGLFLTEYWRRHLGIREPVIGSDAVGPPRDAAPLVPA